MASSYCGYQHSSEMSIFVRSLVSPSLWQVFGRLVALTLRVLGSLVSRHDEMQAQPRYTKEVVLPACFRSVKKSLRAYLKETDSVST
jgi:hypothetical protein